jgi:hypothetical protein
MVTKRWARVWMVGASSRVFLLRGLRESSRLKLPFEESNPFPEVIAL